LTNAKALPWLVIATIGLYGGGVVFNDVFDRNLDSTERAERPLPSGRATIQNAVTLGVSLLAVGIGAAFFASPLSGLIAVSIAACAVLYDAWGKHQSILAPLNMGACRGFNLLLGVSAVPALVGDLWYLMLVPVAYIAAITAVSRGEVHGGQRATGLLALFLLGAVIFGLLLLTRSARFELINVLPFLAIFIGRVIPPFWTAYRNPEPAQIQNAVKAGVLSLIVLDATIAAGFAGVLYGLMVLSLLFVATRIARLFAVT